jgi:tetratricopeptide (TPR) repeat protein
MLYNKGTLHMQLGQGDEAMEMFRGAIAVDPAHVKAMGNLAAVLAASKRHAEAVVLLERALTTLTDTAQGKLPADLAVALGGAYEAASASDEEPASSSTRLQAAHRAYRRALRAHPSHSGAKAHLARLVRSATISYSFAKFSA